jgi:hypothetical protein
MKIKITENTFDESRNFLPAGTALDLPPALCLSLVRGGKAQAVDEDGRATLRKLSEAKREQAMRLGAR